MFSGCSFYNKSLTRKLTLAFHLRQHFECGFFDRVAPILEIFTRGRPVSTSVRVRFGGASEDGFVGRACRVGVECVLLGGLGGEGGEITLSSVVF